MWPCALESGTPPSTKAFGRKSGRETLHQWIHRMGITMTMCHIVLVGQVWKAEVQFLKCNMSLNRKFPSQKVWDRINPTPARMKNLKKKTVGIELVAMVKKGPFRSMIYRQDIKKMVIFGSKLRGANPIIAHYIPIISLYLHCCWLRDYIHYIPIISLYHYIPIISIISPLYPIVYSIWFTLWWTNIAIENGHL